MLRNSAIRRLSLSRQRNIVSLDFSCCTCAHVVHHYENYNQWYIWNDLLFLHVLVKNPQGLSVHSLTLSLLMASRVELSEVQQHKARVISMRCIQTSSCSSTVFSFLTFTRGELPWAVTIETNKFKLGNSSALGYRYVTIMFCVHSINRQSQSQTRKPHSSHTCCRIAAQKKRLFLLLLAVYGLNWYASWYGIIVGLLNIKYNIQYK